LAIEGVVPVLGRADHVVAEVLEELAHVLQPGAGGSGRVEGFGSVKSGGCEPGIFAGAGHPGWVQDVAVDDVAIAAAPRVSLAPDQLVLFELADGLGDGRPG
jgi:hypothetical protein